MLREYSLQHGGLMHMHDWYVSIVKKKSGLVLVVL